MSISIDQLSCAGPDLASLSKGALLTSSAEGRVNVMTIAWGGLLYIWERPVFLAVVRKSRFTWELLEKSGSFSVTLPAPGPGAKAALALAGSTSGRDTDKLASLGLAVREARAIECPVLSLPGTHYECSILSKQELGRSALVPEIAKKYYDDGNLHTVYLAGIAALYSD